MQYSFSNFSLKNLSQPASINFDLVVKKPPNHLFHDKFIRLLWPTYIIPLMIYSYSFLVNSTCLTIRLLCGLKKIFSLLPDLIWFYLKNIGWNLVHGSPSWTWLTIVVVALSASFDHPYKNGSLLHLVFFFSFFKSLFPTSFEHFFSSIYLHILSNRWNLESTSF